MTWFTTWEIWRPEISWSGQDHWNELAKREKFVGIVTNTTWSSSHSAVYGGSLFLHMSYHVWPKGYRFLAALAISRVSILVILVWNRVCLLHSFVEFVYFLFTRSYFFIIIDNTPSTKVFHNAFNIGLNWGTKTGLRQGQFLKRVSNFWSGHK